MELQEPLRRDVSWPLTEPPYFLEAIRALGGEKPLSEALRSLQSSIISGHIPADRWHRRMFSPGSVDGWLALLDEHRTREQAREALSEVGELAGSMAGYQRKGAWGWVVRALLARVA